MDSEKQALILTLFSLLTLLSFTFEPSQAANSGEIAVYWGQNISDGTLNATCDTGNYGTVILAYLNVFGEGRTPRLNITSSQCVNGDCSALEYDIKHCQQNGIKVFLSLGGPYGDYSIKDLDDANDVAFYLNKHFLRGIFAGPLGTVALNGIDFHITAGSNSSWDDLTKELDSYRQGKPGTFYLSAAPQCTFPDYYLNAAIFTGLFDYIYIQFYNDSSCQYSPGDPVNTLYSAWNTWSLNLVIFNCSIFVGLPASSTASGYIPPPSVTSAVLPYLKKVSNYGGVLLWDRGNDVETNYSGAIKPYVPSNQLESVTLTSTATALE